MNTDDTALVGSLPGEFKSIFAHQKQLAERAMIQVSDEQLHQSLHPETNSIAVIVKHLAGNMRSRWTHMLSTDGEKPDRNRDSEFVDDLPSREAVVRRWEEGWACVFHTLDHLAPEDLHKRISIRGNPHTVIGAMLRQVDHYGYHVGQIIQIARILADANWQTLSIPRGESEAYNRRAWGKEGMR